MVCLVTMLGPTAYAGDPAEADTWSAPVNGLQARIRVEEKPKRHGVRWLVPYIELRNVSGGGNPMEVQADREHLKLELVSADGQPVEQTGMVARSGPVPQVGTVVLPYDSSMSISLECTNWGITPNAPAMISTDWGGWTLTEEQNGKIFIRATMKAEKSKPAWKTWHGQLKLPLVNVLWK